VQPGAPPEGPRVGETYPPTPNSASPAKNSTSTIAKLATGGAVLGLAVGGGELLHKAIEGPGQSSQNQTKRTSEAFEGRANAELMEHALGDHDLDK